MSYVRKYKFPSNAEAAPVILISSSHISLAAAAAVTPTTAVVAANTSIRYVLHHLFRISCYYFVLVPLFISKTNVAFFSFYVQGVRA
mmetsp:Transcript_2187/g.3444  ORF Transcript_2187/g.3444 Transcript_2187/m.3444 type:complete len:87 (-) Transcript_2187:579-839(-)